LKVTDVAADKLVFCDSCGKKIKAREHELTLIDEESQQVVGVYHAAPAFGCLRAAEKYTATPGPPMITSWTHPERCGRRLRKCDGGEGDVKAKKEKMT
jgi:hypothetical protein